MCIMESTSPPPITKTFTYNYTHSNGTNQSISYPVGIPLCHETINELAHRIVTEKMDPIMSILDAHLPLKLELTDFVQTQKQQQLCDADEILLNAARMGATDIDQLVRNTHNKYKDEVLEYATKIGPSDDEIFAQSFHRLVHSSSLMDILLKEQSYAKTIIEMNRHRDDEIAALINEQQNEMEIQIDQLDAGTTSEDINNLLSQHYSRQNLVQKQWESELDAKIGHQKNDYRNWIISLLSDRFYSMNERGMATSPTTSMSSFKNDSDRASMFFFQVPAMEESFTIYLGSQLKHMHNMRLIAANIYDFCNLLHTNESISGPNIALGLYSSSLTGVIVLTPSGQVKANREICKNASMSTEFHFEQINKQIESIQSKLEQPKLKAGDFFITRHSNLSQTHVIFHLISDEASNSPEEINSRHPVILGLRNILKTASRYDITNLLIPALLRHEMSEDMMVPWCVRRAELVYKCAKGFMIESASWGGSELSTLQLVLPRDISEELFGILANMVPHVFRLANAKVFST